MTGYTQNIEGHGGSPLWNPALPVPSRCPGCDTEEYRHGGRWLRAPGRVEGYALCMDEWHSRPATGGGD